MAPSVWLLCLSLVLLSIPVVSTPSFAQTAEVEQTIADVTADLCEREIVMLGEEGHHGSGETLAFKAKLVEKLVDRCGFSLILFETGIYDLLEVDRLRRSGHGDFRAELGSAIGGLWNRDREFAPLLDFIEHRLRAGSLDIGGLDHQLGSAGAFYSLDHLPREFASLLSKDRRIQCDRTLRQRIAYDYSRENPYSQAARQELLRCLDEISPPLHEALAAEPQLLEERARMLANVRSWVEADLQPVEDRLNARAAAFYSNFRWFMRRHPKSKKIIIWSATVHAARTASMRDGWRAIETLGARIDRTFGERAFVLGFGAASGSFRRGGSESAEPIALAPSTSLEQIALGDRKHISYLGPGALRLAGIRPASVFAYNQAISYPWGKALDGIVVFRTERRPAPLESE